MNAKCPNRGQGIGFRGQSSGVRIQNLSFRLPPSPFSLQPTAYSLQPRRAFTLIELLVTIAIIGILAGLSLGAIRYARTAAAESQTKATIAKLNDIVMKQYESYMTRRVPIDTSGMDPKSASRLRYLVLLDLMRMEMPERTYDIFYGPLNLPSGKPWIAARPALNQLYYQKYNTGQSHTPKYPLDNYRSAKYLYMWISMIHPEAMEQFSQNEIADIDHDGWPAFVDGWGTPIMFLRWAPGFSSGLGVLPPNPFNPSNPTQPRVDLSDIQTGDPINDHDPFDSRQIFNITGEYYRLVPLIYSAGPDKKYGINIISTASGSGYFYGIDLLTLKLDDLNQYTAPDSTQPNIYAGSPVAENGISNTHLDNIHNHRIEQQ